MTIDGQGRIMIDAEWAEFAKSPASLGGVNTQRAHVQLDRSVDEHYEHAKAAGAEIVQTPSDQFYGDRVYRALDPEGHHWTFSQTIREVSREEAELALGLPISAGQEMTDREQQSNRFWLGSEKKFR